MRSVLRSVRSLQTTPRFRSSMTFIMSRCQLPYLKPYFPGSSLSHPLISLRIPLFRVRFLRPRLLLNLPRGPRRCSLTSQSRMVEYGLNSTPGHLPDAHPSLSHLGRLLPGSFHAFLRGADQPFQFLHAHLGHESGPAGSLGRVEPPVSAFAVPTRDPLSFWSPVDSLCSCTVSCLPVGISQRPERPSGGLIYRAKLSKLNMRQCASRHVPPSALLRWD